MSDPLFPDDMTLADAQAKLRELVEDGYRCPTCTQFAKVYYRSINSGMAVALIRLHRAAPNGEFVHLPDLLAKHGQQAGGDPAKLRFWGLIEEEPIVRPDGGRAGYWRVTGLGRRFVMERQHVAKRVRLYDNRLLNLDSSKGYVTIREALGKKFRYDELMAGGG